MAGENSEIIVFTHERINKPFIENALKSITNIEELSNCKCTFERDNIFIIKGYKELETELNRDPFLSYEVCQLNEISAIAIFTENGAAEYFISIFIETLLKNFHQIFKAEKTLYLSDSIFNLNDLLDTYSNGFEFTKEKHGLTFQY
ncbi:MAG: hypothetical protein CMO01_12410 [Thalassobius sp.]|nr:hypothetical protein [Thalassovita sp.]